MKRTRSLSLPALAGAALLVVATSAPAQEAVTPTPPVAPLQFSEVLFPYSLLDAAFEGRVDKTGMVDYTQLKGDKNLGLFLDAVARADRSKFPTPRVSIDPKDPKSGKREDKGAELVFLINAHNALLVKALSDAYPVNSPDDVRGLWTDKKFVVGGQNYSLGVLRDEIIKREPRAIFALTSGTLNGPGLAPKAYRSADLNELLEASARGFINDQRHVELLRINNEVTVSPYFQEADAIFKPRASRQKWDGVRYLLQSYTDRSAEKRYFGAGNFKVSFKPADRKINNIILKNGSA